ncbi:MAG: N-6 DNA methylase [Candidatus Aminicenantes bacterium]|nr:MAG: N-6 DNA methylase [Candidatus Aminicenantes bacterium]
MILNKNEPKKALNKAFLKVKVGRDEIEKFKTNLVKLLDQINEKESEEFHKNIISEFLKNTYYGSNHYINTKGRYDLVIHNGKDGNSPVGVIIETKSPKNKNEMISTANLNNKAFHELIFYFLQERINNKNLEIRFLIATNIYEWFIFDANIFEENFAKNKELVRLFGQYSQGSLSGSTADFFYKNIAEPIMATIESGLMFTHFDIRDYNETLRNTDKIDDIQLIALYKLLSPVHLLKIPFANDSNRLDKAFYSELLHLIGLAETKEGSKKLIERKKEGSRNNASLIENAIEQLDSLDKLSRLGNPGQYGNDYQERLFNVALELTITWVNRILFLKLLEAQLISYHKGDRSYAFLNSEMVKNFDDLNSLFFSVLARKTHERSHDVKKLFARVPYLNSSLFEPTELEHSCFFIGQLKDGKLPLITTTVLRDNSGKRRTGELPILEYFFEFLNAYDFAGEGDNEIAEENKTLINASVLGLIFEKINGYKDGSFFTPGFITMYMCRETIWRAIVQKFNDAKGWKCAKIDDLYDKIEDRGEANRIINRLKICDPAVGSGHFLVSALNEIIAVKSELKILSDREGKRLKEYQVEVVNDELVVTDEDGDIFKYNPNSAESRRVQETLFHEKQTIIENCLFGVDINPNSVKICRLRLWIELLKNAYYKSADNELETLPNIDINIKCGNSLISRFTLDADIKQALKKSKWTIESYRMAVMAYRNASSKEEKWGLVKLIEDIKKDFQFEVSRNDRRKLKLDKLKDDLFHLTKQGYLFEMSKAEKESREKEVNVLVEAIGKLELELEEIKSNKIYENAFEWRFEFPEVLNDDGDFVGFDVVIGNPPYGVDFSDKLKSILNQTYPGIQQKMFDSFLFFISLSEKILIPSGTTSYIVPNNLIYQVTFEAGRKFLLTNFIFSKVVNLGDKVFEDADVPTCILNTFAFVFGLKEDHFNLIKKIDKQAIKLSELIESASYGIGSGGDRVFRLDEAESIEKGLEKDILFDVYSGGNISKWHIKKKKEKIIYTTRDLNINDYPNILKHLLPHKEKLSQKRETKKGTLPWWCLHWPRNKKLFNGEKIVLRQTSDTIIAALDLDSFFVMDSVMVIKLNNDNGLNLKYVLALLNSKLFAFLYENIAKEKGRAFAQVKPQNIKQLPVKIINGISQKPIISLVDKILAAKKAAPDADISALEEKIDRLVYELYDLTEEEIKIVEGK